MVLGVFSSSATKSQSLGGNVAALVFVRDGFDGRGGGSFFFGGIALPLFLSFPRSVVGFGITLLISIKPSTLPQHSSSTFLASLVNLLGIGDDTTPSIYVCDLK
jgi:hypothetical protein